MRETTYYFARINHVNLVEYKLKSDFILKGLSSKAVVSHRNFNYKFVGIGKTTFDESSIVYGYLVKYDPDFEEEIFDEKSGTLVDAQVSNKVTAKCKFIIHLNSSIVMYHEAGQLISKTAFVNLFSDLFEQNHDKFFVEFRIQALLEKYAFLDELKKFITVKRVKIKLVPANPRFSDRWKSIQDRMVENNISNYEEFYENRRENESIKIDDSMRNGMLMSEDGYGESQVYGITNEGEKTITTNDKQRQVKRKAPSNTDDLVVILERLRGTLKELIERTNG
jgi:hypothetical protein